MNEIKKFEFGTFSIVVVADKHNPSLLNPDFLQMREIVPKEYELAEPTLTSPPVAIVKYKQGISITVEIEKLQILEDITGKLGESEVIPDIAKKYIHTLPHVRYTGVGINWMGSLQEDNPGMWIRDKFLAKGPWNAPAHDLFSTRIQLSYRLDDAKCNLSLEDGQVAKKEESPVPVVIVNANYHHNISEYPADEAVATIIGRWKEHLDHFLMLIRDVLGART